jgi:hypothetical protein
LHTSKTSKLVSQIASVERRSSIITVILMRYVTVLE